MRWFSVFTLVAWAHCFPAVNTTADTIWHWVDENGHAVYSNLEPPAQARDVTVIELRWAADHHLTLSTTGGHHTEQVESHRLLEAYDILLHELYDLRGYVDDLRNDASDLRYVLHTPEADYAYSRRYYWGPRRQADDDRHPRPRQHQRRQHFGQRQYDRNYFNNAYRYRSSLPHYAKPQAPPASR